MGSYTHMIPVKFGAFRDPADGLRIIVRSRDLQEMASRHSRGWAVPMPDCGFVASIIRGEGSEGRLVTYAFGRTIEESEQRAAKNYDNKP